MVRGVYAYRIYVDLNKLLSNYAELNNFVVVDFNDEGREGGRGSCLPSLFYAT